MRSREKWVRLLGSEKAPSARARVTGKARDDDSFEVLVSVRPRHKVPPMDAAEPVKGRTGRPGLGEYAANYGAAPKDLERIAAFASEHGLRVVSSDAIQRTVVLSGTVAAFSEAFRVTLYAGEIRGKRHRLRSGVIKIPEGLKGIVTGVFGLDNRPLARPHVAAPKLAAHGDRAFTASEIARLYHFPANATGAGETIGIIELAGGYRTKDLEKYFHELGIKGPEIINAGAGKNSPGIDEVSDIEVSLDIEVAAAVAPGARQVIYFASERSDAAYLKVLNTAVFDDQHRPSVLCITWGAPEKKATQQFLDEAHKVLLAAAHLRITVCVSTGDNGSADFPLDDPDNPWDGQAHVDFPASDPYSLACGGTSLVFAADRKTITEEVVFSNGKNDGTGGGISRYFPLPRYQGKAGVPRARNPDGPVKRGIPDVAGNADKKTGYVVFSNGKRFPDAAKKLPAIGGTSAVAPLWAGLIALMNQSLGMRLGFINPIIYKLPRSAGAFRDIQKGTNGDYSAGPGWDACTGLGSPDGEALLNAFRNTIN